MAYSREQLIATMRKAHAAGDEAAVRQLDSEIKALDSTSTVAQDQSVLEQYDPTADMSGYDKFMTGVGRGAVNMGRGVQDLYYRARGDDDALTQLNGRIQREEAGWEHLTKNSTAASVGEFVGEVAATVPAGFGVAGAGAKLGMGALKVAGLEGALVEGITQRGDFGDRMQSAAGGAVLGMAGQGAVDFVGSRFQKAARKADLDDIAKPFNDTIDSAKRRVAQADTDGGFNLDMADATGNSAAIREKSDISNMDGEVTLRRFMAGQETDITAKAQSFLDGTGGNHISKIETGEEIQELLVGLRNNEKAAYKKLYAEIDGATGGRVLDTSDLKSKLPPLLNDHKITGDATANKVNQVLEKFGVLEKKSSELPNPWKVGGAESIPTVEKPLTASNYEDLIGELNALYKPLGTSGEGALIGQTKKMLEDWIDGALLKHGADNGIVELGRSARIGRRNFARRWEAGDALEKLTSKKPGDADYKMLASQAVEHFTRPKNINDLRRLRGKLNLGSPADKKLWADMQHAPLLKAFEAATKNVKDVAEGGVIQFNEKAFKNTWVNSMSKEAKELLYGVKKVKEIDRALAAFSLRGKRARVASEANMSGTARGMVGIFARMFLPAGRSAGAALAGMPILKDVVSGFKHAGQRKAGDILASGGMTPSQVKRTAKEIEEALREHYKGSDLLNYDRAIATLARAMARPDSDE